jgi:hypothetical protein
MIDPNINFEDILDALTLEETEPSYTALLRWSERYPEHRNQLANFFATWAVQAELPHEIVVEEARLTNLAVSQALDIVHRRNEEAKHTQKAITTQSWLTGLVGDAEISEEQIEMDAKLDDTMVAKLNIRRLTGIPRKCFELLATVLGVPANRIEEMTTGPPLIAMGTHHKTRRKPILKTEDFAEAVRNSNLSEDAQRFWFEVIAAEREEDKQ